MTRLAYYLGGSDHTKNKGAMMGCSNPHPHGQVWSMSDIPSIPLKELSALKRYVSTGPADDTDPDKPPEHHCLLCEYASLEESSARLVLKNKHWIAIVPWWATWPFEVLRTYMYLANRGTLYFYTS